MSDWIDNTLTVTGDPAKIKEFMKEQTGPGMWDSKKIKKLQFNNLIPYPKNATRDSIYDGNTHQTSLYDRHGCQWEIDNWGVKWGAFNIEIQYKKESNNITYTFNTAWHFADKWFKALITKYKHLTFYVYAQADNRGFIIELDIKNGKVISSNNTIGEDEVMKRIKLIDPEYHADLTEEK